MRDHEIEEALSFCLFLFCGTIDSVSSIAREKTVHSLV